MPDVTKAKAAAPPPQDSPVPAAPISTAASAAEGPVLTRAPDLEAIPGSTAPALADGTQVFHVRGPQQAAVDPVAAGLDTGAVVAASKSGSAGA